MTAEDSEQEKRLSNSQELKPYAGLRLEEQFWGHVTRLFACMRNVFRCDMDVPGGRNV